MKHLRTALCMMRVDMDDRFKVTEKFISINGEGTKAGQPAVFIRFVGCNLNCSYCDTRWANSSGAPYELMSAEDILDYIVSTGIKNVTLTGGEPLIQKGIKKILELIALHDELYCEIETNGSVPLRQFCDIKNRPSFTMDYKLISSGMEEHMLAENFALLDKRDTVKFVSGTLEDLIRAKQIMDEHDLYGKVSLYISPVFGMIEPADIVEFMLREKMNNVNLQLQMHKIIWDPDRRGV